MNIKSTYVTTEYRSMRQGANGALVHCGHDRVEIYAPSIKPNDWYLIKTIGVCEDDTEIELSSVIVKR